jgi:RNA-directed DNA polymerase
MKNGVGQLAFTFGFPEGQPKDGAEETQSNGSGASSQPVAVGSEPREPPRKRKWHSLIDKVYALQNLQSAWERVRANRGAAGVDGMTLRKFAERADARLQQLSQELRAKTYRPQPVRRVFIPKSGGGQRPLGIPTVRDRIVQQALLQVLEPIFEGKFSSRSHGFRPGRGGASALEVVDRAVRHGYGWVVDADLQSFFDTVDQEKLLDALNEEVADGRVLKLIRRILQAGVSLPATAETEPTELGTPQGGPLSPLLANVYLHAFDVEMVQAGYGLVRYADDFVIFARSKSEAEAALEQAHPLLEGQLGLRLHPEKTRVVSVAQGFEFLGFHYYADPKDPTGARLRKEVRRKSVQRFREAIRARTPRLKNQRLPKQRHVTLSRLRRNRRVAEMIEELNRYLEGWHGYFKRVWSHDWHMQTFDQFVRRRVRTAITGRIGKGWWLVQLSNAVLAELGLVSVAHLNRGYGREPWDASARKSRPGGEPYAGKPHVRFG